MSVDIAYVDNTFTEAATLQALLQPHFQLTTFHDPQKLLDATSTRQFQIVIAKEAIRPLSGQELLRQMGFRMADSYNILLSSPGSRPGNRKSNYTKIVADKIDAQFIRRLIDAAVVELHRWQHGDNISGKNMLIGRCPKIKDLLAYSSRIAQSNRPVLVSGETGTGKDVFARRIHQLSPRNRQPLQIVNCAAISPELFESEFFGHIKGAFTGAGSDHRGHFSLADGGTLVLDEISEMDLRFQVKLLRAIENQEIYPVGSQKVVKLDTRIIALTNRNLTEAVKSGRFRADLYHRLNSFQLYLPPLRERGSDIKLLAEHFLRNSWLSILGNWESLIDDGFYELLKQLPFAGNIRDLQNLIARVLSHKLPTQPQIDRADLEAALPQEILQNLNPSDRHENLNDFLRRMERSRIFDALRRNDFNITQTARQLGLSRQSLQHRLRRHQPEG